MLPNQIAGETANALLNFLTDEEGRQNARQDVPKPISALNFNSENSLTTNRCDLISASLAPQFVFTARMATASFAATVSRGPFSSSVGGSMN
jgi:hypothetical protein